MAHDRIHAREPTHAIDRWRTGRIQRLTERDGHCFVEVVPDGGEADETRDAEAVELKVTFAIRDLFVDRLALDEGESPVGSRVWFREYGGS